MVCSEYSKEYVVYTYGKVAFDNVVTKLQGKYVGVVIWGYSFHFEEVISSCLDAKVEPVKIGKFLVAMSLFVSIILLMM
jgi:hypothetical protein